MNVVVAIVVLALIFVGVELYIYKKENGEGLKPSKQQKAAPDTSGLTYCEYNSVNRADGIRYRISIRPVGDNRCEVYTSGKTVGNVREISTIREVSGKALEDIDAIITDHDMADWKNLLKGDLRATESASVTIRFIRDGETVVLSNATDIPAGGENAFDEIRACMEVYARAAQVV